MVWKVNELTCRVDNTDNLLNIDSDNFTHPKVEGHLSIFVYPFFFTLGKLEELLILALEDPNWMLDYPEQDNEKEMRRIEYFLPYMQRFLFPATHWGEKEKRLFRDKFYRKKNKRGKRTGWFVRTRQAKRLCKDHVVRWRRDFGDMPLDFVLSNGNGSQFSARWKKISLFLYSTGVGLLVMEVEKSGRSVDLRLSELALFNKTLNCLDKVLFGNLAPALVNGVPLRTLILDTFLKPFVGRSILEADNYNLGKTFLHYCCLACLDGTQYAEPANDYYNNFALMQDDSDFKVLDFKGTRCGFTPKGIHILAVAEQKGWPGVSDFLRHWQTFYLDIYLHAFYQNLSLIKFSRELSGIDELLNDRRKLEQLQRLFLNFTNKTWFNLVTSAPFGQKLWKKWKDVMVLEELYKEVKLQLSEFNSYTEQVKKERFSRILNALSIVGTSLAITYGLFTSGILRLNESWLEVSPLEVGLIVGMILAVITVLGVLFLRLPRLKPLWSFTKSCLRNWFKGIKNRARTK